MRVLPFTVPKTKDESFRVEIENESHFYGELHAHPEIQITYIYESTGTLVAGDYIGPFEPGNLFVFGSNQPHVFKNDAEYYLGAEDLKANCISLFLRKDMFGMDFMQMPEIEQLRDFFALTDLGIVVHKSASIKLLPLIDSFKTAKGFSKLVCLFNLLESLVSDCTYQPLSSSVFRKELNEKEGKRMNAIYQFTLKEYTNNITIVQVAEIANLTPPSFCRYFKKHTRRSYNSFLTEIRIGHACKMLLNSTDPVIDICYASGFNNLSNFNRQFKSSKGLSPKEYRKQLIIGGQ